MSPMLQLSYRNDNRMQGRTRGRGGGRDGYEDRGFDTSNGLPEVPPEWLR